MLEGGRGVSGGEGEREGGRRETDEGDGVLDLVRVVRDWC